MSSDSVSGKPRPTATAPGGLHKINIGIVGATGVVGETFLNLMEERYFPVGELRLFASEASAGQTKQFNEVDIPIRTLSEGCFDGLHLVFFSSGDEISATWAPKAVAAGAFAVDNSGAFRMSPDIALVVPEINGDLLPSADRPALIANPNCSTIQLVLALEPLRKAFGLKAVRVASYQSVSGAGRAGIEELFSQTRVALEGDEPAGSGVFPKAIAFDCIPQIGAIGEDGYCTEETKIMNETRKILRQDDLLVSAFTVRVPTMNGHAEAVWATLGSETPTVADVRAAISGGAGLELIDSGGPHSHSAGQNQSHAPAAASKGPGYPTQALASGLDPVYVGRVHRDRSDASTWHLWVVADNLRKGAALNGIQIAERIFDIK